MMKKVRLLAASFSTTALLLYIAIVTYLPALALEQVDFFAVCRLFLKYIYDTTCHEMLNFKVTGIDINTACITIFIVCVFYTTVGGFKAVRLTDGIKPGCKQNY